MMTLSASHLKLFTGNQREKERAFWCSGEIALRREIGFLVHQKRVSNGFCRAVSFRPIFAVSSAQTNVESEEIETVSSDQPKTVHVRFELHKECAFGQQFLIVGDDTILGLWDPSEGVPLNWSEGHVWTAELDIPIGKVIKYKFILKGKIGITLWQPGPDRILETWETDKIIYVSEDWDNPELRNIVESDVVDDNLNEEFLVNSDLSMNVNQALVEEGDNVDGNKDCSDKTSDELEGQDLSLSDKGSGVVSVTDEKRGEISNLLSSKDETGLVLDEGFPVLVPGLVPRLMDEIELEDLDEVEKNDIVENATGSDEIKDSNKPELKDECVSTSLHSTETSEKMVDEENLFYGEETSTESKDEHAPALLHSINASEMMVVEKQRQYGEEQMESDALESDIQWGRRTFKKLLANLGFM